MPSRNDQVPNGYFDPANSNMNPVAGGEFANGYAPLPQSGSKRPYLNANKEHAKMLKALDSLRHLGLENLRGRYSLPQIIVCGSQSSGKSSVLEAIAGIPFPQKRGLCTKYKTRVTLLRKTEAEITLSIKPDPERDSDEADALLKFEKTINIITWDSLRESMRKQIDAATALIFQGSRAKKQYTNDTLCISITGPDEIDLELLDLPGLIDADPWNDNNIQRVGSMVAVEMEKDHSIVLAVVEAGKDLLTHKILQKCADLNIPSERTLGVLTMPDLATADQASSHVYIVQGKDAQFRKTFPLQWHVLRNRNEEESKDGISLEVRERKETHFFQTVAPWNQLNQNGPGIAEDDGVTGIRALRKRLSVMLFNTAKETLPILYKNLQRQKTSLLTKLAELGGDLAEDQMMRAFRKSVTRLKKMTGDHARGHFEADIRRYNLLSPVYFRSRVIEQGEAFGDKLLQTGHTWELESHTLAIDPNNDLRSVFRAEIEPTEQNIATYDREEAIERFVLRIRTLRREGLSVFDNDEVVYREFWLLSDKWSDIAKEHIEKVFECCRSYFKIVTPMAFSKVCTIPSSIPREGFGNHAVVAKRFRRRFLDPELEKCRYAALQGLDDLEGDRLAICTDPDKEFVVKFRELRDKDIMRRALALLENRESLNEKQEIGAADIATIQGLHTPEDWAREHAEKLVNALWTQYEIVRRNYVTNVSQQIIGRRLMRVVGEIIPDDLKPEEVSELMKADTEVEEEKRIIKKDLNIIEAALPILEEFVY